MSKITKIVDIKIVGTDELVRLEQEITKAEQKLKNMTKAGKNNAGMQKIHTKNIAKTKVELKQLRAQRSAEQKAVIANTQATKKLDGSYNSLVQRNKQLLTRMKATKGGINSNTAEMKKMKAEYVDNNTKLKDFDKGLGNNQRNVGNYGSALGSAKEKLVGVGVALAGAMAGFTALSRIVNGATADFGRFEKTFTNVLTLMSSDDINKFGESMKTGAIDVMKEFGFEIDDLNKSLFDAVSAGVPASESIDFLRTASQLAVGGVTELSTAVDGITSVINAYGLETSEAEQVASAFFSAQKFGKTTVSELSETIGSVAPIARQAGVSYQELLSAFAELTKQGISTDKASTALRSTITALIKPGKDAADQFDKLGIAYGASGLKQEGFFNILTKISEEAEKQPDILAQLIPNVRALTGVGALGTEQLKEYSEILKEVTEDYGDNSSLANAVEMQQATLEQQLASAKGEFKAQRIELGERLKPAVITLINGFTSLLDNIEKVGNVVKAGITSFLIYKGLILANTVAMKGLTRATITARIQQTALNKAVKANPYIFVASLVIGLVTALGLFSKSAEKARKKQSALNEELRRGKELSNDIGDIEDRIKIYNKLNRTQKEQLVSATQGTLTELNTQKSAIQVFREKNKEYQRLNGIIQEYRQKIKGVNKSNNMASAIQASFYGQIEMTKEKIKDLEIEKFGFSHDEVGAKIRRYSKLIKLVNKDLEKKKKNTDDGNKSLDDQEEKLLSIAVAMALEEDTLNQLSEKIKQLKGNRDDLTINSEEYNEVTKELTRLQEKQTKATKTAQKEDKKKAETTQDKIDAETLNMNMLKSSTAMVTEAAQSELRLRQLEIDAILEKARVTGTLTAEETTRLNTLKQNIQDVKDTLKDDEGMSPFEKAFYGEGVQNALNGLATGLQTIGQIGQGQAELDRVNAENKIFQLDTERETAIKNLEESSAFKVMSQEQQDDALLKINEDFDARTNKIREAEFEKQKKLDKSQAKISGALAIMRIWSSKITGNAVVDAIIKAAMIGIQIQNTSKQIAAINATQFRAEQGGIVPQFAKGGMVNGPRHAQGGVKFAVGGQVAELEGGEAVINRRSTAMFRGQLSAMNEAGGGRKFADGGTIAIQNQLQETANRSIITEQDVGRIAMALGSQRVTLLESDVTQTQETVSILESRAEF